MDLIIHLLTTSRGYDSIAIFVDCLSKYTSFVPCSVNVTAEELAHLFLSSVVARQGMPTSIVSDHDSQFTSKFWKTLVDMFGCKQAMNSAYHPQSDV